MVGRISVAVVTSVCCIGALASCRSDVGEPRPVSAAPAPRAAEEKKVAPEPVAITLDDFLAQLADGKSAHVTDMQIDGDGSVYVLSTRLRGSPDFRKDPDGTKSYRGEVVLTRIAPDKTLAQAVVDRLYCCNIKGFSAQRGALKIDGDKIVIFYTEKDTGGNYGQAARMYRIGKSVAGQSATSEDYFKSSNWGWFPYFDENGVLQHFSFAGYYGVTEKSRSGSISPNRFRERMIAARLRRVGLSGTPEGESQMSQAFLAALTGLAAGKPIGEDKPVAAAAAPAAALPSRAFPAFIDIPGQYTITTDKGCRLNNPSPQPHETVSWTGACRNGYADGFGTLTWFQDGKPSSPPATTFLNKGFFLVPGGKDFPEMVVNSQSDGKCRIILPLSAVKAMASRFDVQFDGACPQNASTIIHEDRAKVRANILLAGQLFATFDGTLTKGAIPIAGEMIFFNGTRFRFNGANPFGGILTASQIGEWQRSIDVVRGGAAQGPQVPQESFAINIGFNAKPAAPKEVSEKVLFFQLDGISGATTLKMNYDISPAKTAKLTAKSYVVSLKAEVQLEKTSKVGWFGVSEANSIVKPVDVLLERKNGYRATGEVVLSQLQAYAHAMGVTITTQAKRPTVTVVSITAEP